MTYNILTGGRDGLQSGRLEKILEVIERQQPDLLALQECNLFDADSRHVFHWFERRLQMRGMLALAESGFHVAVFAKKLEIVASAEETGWCQHAMMKTQLLCSGQALEFISVHHNPFSGTSRLTEAEYLAGNSRPDCLQLIMGDFNANSPQDEERIVPSQLPARYRSRQTVEINGRRQLDTRSVSTLLEAQYIDLYDRCNPEWQSTVPTLLVDERQRYPMRIDFAFASKSLAERVENCQVVKSELTEQASDHYPLVVDFAD